MGTPQAMARLSPQIQLMLAYPYQLWGLLRLCIHTAVQQGG